MTPPLQYLYASQALKKLVLKHPSENGELSHLYSKLFGAWTVLLSYTVGPLSIAEAPNDYHNTNNIDFIDRKSKHRSVITKMFKPDGS